MDSFEAVKKLFAHCSTPHERYQKLIELGRSLPPMSTEHQIEKNVVKGCQSIVYLTSELHEGKLFFLASSDALISSGLAALLLQAYNGQTPEFIIKTKPQFLEDLQIFASLSPSRSNGAMAMYLRMQQEAVKNLSAI